ncbi:MAG: hypothetical protein AB1756_09215 [Acidobacteriota bacterium]
MADKDKKVARRRYFLLNSSQPEIFSRILILFMLAVLITAWAFYLMANREIENEWYKAHSTLKYVSQMFLPWLIMANIAGIAIVATFLIFLTHKIAGASYRIKKDLEVIKKGNLSKKIKLRKKDQLHDVAEAVNHAFEEIRERMEKVAASVIDMEMKINSTLYYLGDGNDRERAREEAAKLISDIRHVKDYLESIAP